MEEPSVQPVPCVCVVRTFVLWLNAQLAQQAPDGLSQPGIVDCSERDGAAVGTDGERPARGGGYAFGVQLEPQHGACQLFAPTRETAALPHVGEQVLARRGDGRCCAKREAGTILKVSGHSTKSAAERHKERG